MKELGMLLCHLAFMLETDRVVHRVNLKNQMIQFFKDLIKITKSVVCLVLILFSLNLTPTLVGSNCALLTVYIHSLKICMYICNVNVHNLYIL